MVLTIELKRKNIGMSVYMYLWEVDSGRNILQPKEMKVHSNK